MRTFPLVNGGEKLRVDGDEGIRNLIHPGWEVGSENEDVGRKMARKEGVR
jgi:hypothetical protein